MGRPSSSFCVYVGKHKLTCCKCKKTFGDEDKLASFQLESHGLEFSPIEPDVFHLVSWLKSFQKSPTATFKVDWPCPRPGGSPGCVIY